MEYEIGDDPQGLPEQPDGDRGGGLREGRILFSVDAPARRGNRHDEIVEEDSPVRQFGEAA